MDEIEWAITPAKVGATPQDQPASKEVPGDPLTDKDWTDLQGKERWNFRIYSRTDHLIEFEGVKVRLSTVNTEKISNGKTYHTWCTKDSLQ